MSASITMAQRGARVLARLRVLGAATLQNPSAPFVETAHVTALRRIVWLLAAAGLALRLIFAMLPLPIHLLLLEDDAWMVAAIARNFALGNGITADGVNPTNGFQPLYPLTFGTLPYLAAPEALHFGFTANLVICALLGALALWPLWWLARYFGGEVAGLLAVALFALNPYLIRISVNAMETALGVLLLLTLFAAFYRLDLARLRTILLLAVLTALAVLARLDASLAFAAITLTMLLRIAGQGRALQKQSQGWQRFVVRRLLYVALYVLVTLALLGPYFAFNRAISGSFGPSSGAALAFMHSYANHFHLTNGVQGIRLNAAVNLTWLASPTMVILLTLTLAGVFAWLLGRRLFVALPLLLYLPVPPLYYGYILQQSRDRYFVGLSAIVILLLAWLGAELWRRRPARTTAAAVAVATVAIIGLNTWEALSNYRFRATHPSQTQPTSYEAALWISANLPQGAVIAAKNSGIYQYYSGHVILNIDGKLNHEILPVLAQRTLLPYLRAQGVEYLVDREETMARHVMFYSEEFGPAPNHRVPRLTERIEIYGKIAANRLGANLPLDLNPPQEEFVPTRPFSDVAEIVQRFERPNEAGNPVVIYRLQPTGQ